MVWPSRFTLFVCAGLLPALTPFLAAGDEPQFADTYELIQHRLERKIDAFEWGAGELIVYVRDLDYGITVMEREADRFFAPGSIMKLFLAAGALETLGPAYRFTTEMYIDGVIEGGKLKGAVFVHGNGDPTFGRGPTPGDPIDYAAFDRWAEALRSEGIHSVRGNLVLDESAFDAMRFAPGWPLNRLGSPRLPEISALNFNENCIHVHWQPGDKDGAIAKFKLRPELPDFVYVSNNVRLVKSDPDGRRIFRQPNSRVINISGELPLGVAAVDRAGMFEPANYFAAAMRHRLNEKGIEIEGATQVLEKPTAGDHAAPPRLIDLFRSPPLEAIVPDMIRYDRTLDAEALLKTLGRRRTGEAGSFDAGAEELYDSLKRQGLESSGLVVIDGSGLSGLNRTSARQIMKLMELHVTPGRDSLFERAFPRNGTPGILADRLLPEAGTTAATTPPIHAVAGRSRHGLGLAGWTRTPSGRAFHFVFFIHRSALPEEALRTQIEALALEIAR